MQTTTFLPLSPAIKSVTIIASIIILATMGYMAYQWYTTKQVMLLVTFVIVAIALLSCMVLIPRKLTVTTEDINIHLLAWKINIPADEIVKIEHYPHGIQSSRIAGAGGLLWQFRTVYKPCLRQAFFTYHRFQRRLRYHP